MLRNKISLAVALMGLASLAAAALSAQTFSNAGAISIPSSGTATPYPSTINVSGLSGNPSAISVSLNGFGHTWCNDVDVLLVGPGGATVVLMSDCGGTNSVSGVNLTFTDTAATALTTGAIVSGTYAPTNLEGTGDAFAAPAPAQPHGTNFASFLTQSPNGTWGLYVVDDVGGDSGAFSGGWSITLTMPSVAPTITSTAGTSAFVGQAYTYNIAATGNPAPTFSVAGNPAWLTLAGNVLSGTPTAGDLGTAGPITITATNGVAPDDTEVFSITVAPSAPEIDVQDVDAISLSSPHAYTVYGAWAGAALNGTFVIRNIGNVGLDITAVTVSATVNCSATFVPTGTPTFTIAAAGSDNCAASVTPTAAGAFSFTVTITSTDADEPTFTINFSGTAQATNAPDIAVRYLTTNIANGSTTTQANTGVATFNRPYTFRNEGSGALTLNGTPIVAISALVNCSVVVNDPASTNIAAADWNAATEAWSLDITPTAAGPFSFTVTVANDDADENPFVFNFSGHTASFPVIGGGGGDDDGCSTGNSNGNSWMLLAALLASLAVAVRMTRARA